MPGTYLPLTTAVAVRGWGESMTEPRKLTPQELFRMAADPDAALLALGGSAGAAVAVGSSGGKNGSAPKKRRKKSAAWEAMIAITAKPRGGKGH